MKPIVWGVAFSAAMMRSPSFSRSSSSTTMTSLPRRRSASTEGMSSKGAVFTVFKRPEC